MSSVVYNEDPEILLSGGGVSSTLNLLQRVRWVGMGVGKVGVKVEIRMSFFTTVQ